MKMLEPVRLRILAVVMVLMACCGDRAVAIAQIAPSPAPSPGIDLIFLIDQSGSMWHDPRYPSGPNDRWGHRIVAAHDTIERLAEDAESGQAVHRVTVIDFATIATVALDTYEIRRQPGQPGAALSQARMMATKYVAERKDPRNVFTDTAAAFRLAATALQKFGPAPANRRRVLILITDGRPYVDSGNPDRMLETQRRDIQSSIDGLKKLGVHISVLGLSDATDYWNSSKNGLRDGEYWEKATGGNATLAQHAFPDLHQIIGGLLDPWLASKSVVVSGDTVIIPPFLRRAVFSAVFDQPDAPLDIYDPSGRLVRTPPANPGARLRRIAIANPTAGIWRIVRQTGFSYFIRLETQPPGVERLEPLGLAALQTTTKLTLRLTGDGGAPMAVAAPDIVAATVTIVSPSGGATARPLAVLADGALTTDWLPAEGGRHDLRVSLQARHAGSTVDVFAGTGAGAQATVEVSTQRPVFLALVAPDPSVTITTYGGTPTVDTEFGLVEPDGKPLSPADVGLSDPTAFLSLQTIDPAGLAIGTPIAATFDKTTGHWRIPVPVAIAWSAGEGWWGPAQVRLRAQPATLQLAGDRVLDSLRLPKGSEHLRLAADPWTVGPIAVALPFALLVLACLVLGALSLAAIAGLLLRGIPAAIIHARDTGSGRRLEISVYDPVADPFRQSARTIPVGGRSRVCADRSIVLQVAGVPTTLPTFRFIRDLADTRTPTGELRYRWPKDTRDRTMRLRAGEAVRQLMGNDASQCVVSLNVRKI